MGVHQQSTSRQCDASICHITIHRKSSLNPRTIGLALKGSYREMTILRRWNIITIADCLKMKQGDRHREVICDQSVEVIR